MSSSTYSAELYPDAVLRWLVLFSGSIFGAAGIALILTLPLHWLLLVAGSVGWLTLFVSELVGMSRGFVRCCRLRMTPDGEILLLDPEGNWHAARLLPGSVLLRRVGWIRLKIEQGQQCAEPVRGSCRESEDWRRLHVIWRHIGATPRSC